MGWFQTEFGNSDGRAFDAFPERRYACFLVSDELVTMWFRQRERASPSVLPPDDTEILVYFQAVLQVGNNGQYQDAEVIACHLDLSRMVWRLAVHHHSFAPVPLLVELPEMALTFHDDSIKSDYLKVLEVYQQLIDGCRYGIARNV